MIWTEKRDSRSLFYMCMLVAWGRISQDMGLGMSQGLDTFSRICSGSVTAALCGGRQIQRCCATSDDDDFDGDGDDDSDDNDDDDDDDDVLA